MVNHDQSGLSRRQILAMAAAAPGVALAGKAMASEGQGAASNAIKHTIQLGDFEVSTLLVGSRVVEGPQNIFGMNVGEDEFASVSEANFLPIDKARFFFTPTVVRTADDIVLFDAGLSAQGTTAALAQAGITPEQVSVVVVTHMHGDHIGGLTGEDGTETFSNARYVTGQAEYDAWAKRDNERFEAKVRPLAEKMSFVGDNESVVSGITSMAAFGHTPGHMVYRLESGSQQLLVAADTANHFVWSLAYPDWEVKFDMDKSAAAATRKNVFGMLAAEKIPFIGYHMPFPGVGYVANRG
ncbi:MAG: MBL fold metallo-hydrolase, partial [Pseudomonadota bacterium]